MSGSAMSHARSCAFNRPPICFPVVCLARALEYSRLGNHEDGVLRSQRDLRLHIDQLSRNQPQAPLLSDGREKEHSFHPGKGLSNALPGTSSKGKIRKTRTAGFVLGEKAVRVEAQRVREVPRAALDDVLAK